MIPANQNATNLEWTPSLFQRSRTICFLLWSLTYSHPDCPGTDTTYLLWLIYVYSKLSAIRNLSVLNIFEVLLWGILQKILEEYCKTGNLTWNCVSLQYYCVSILKMLPVSLAGTPRLYQQPMPCLRVQHSRSRLQCTISRWESGYCDIDFCVECHPPRQVCALCHPNFVQFSRQDYFYFSINFVPKIIGHGRLSRQYTSWSSMKGSEHQH